MLKKQAASSVKPGALGLDAYYAELDAAAAAQPKALGGDPAEDENLKSDSDEEVPYLVEDVSTALSITCFFRRTKTDSVRSWRNEPCKLIPRLRARKSGTKPLTIIIQNGMISSVGDSIWLCVSS
jgi:hypothetical protein